MNKFIFIILYLIGTNCVLMMLVWVGSKYDWMSEMQPGISSGVIDDPSDNRQISKLLLLSFGLILYCI